MRNITINAECMRDLCGEFYTIKNNDRNNMLVHLIPEATKMAVTNDPEWFGCGSSEQEIRDTYNEMLKDGFEFMLNEYESTKQVLSDWVDGKRRVSEFTSDEIAAIADGYYIHSVSARVESIALGFI